MQKIVCLTSRVLTENKIEKQFVNTRYLTPLHKRGLNTLMLTLDTPDPEFIFDRCDAFLVTGGTDINPSCYNDINTGLSQGVDDRLDRLDQRVITYAKAHHKPLLGICRGHQSLNVFMGGSLIQDLNPVHVSSHHLVHTKTNRLLACEETISTNSFHHQGILKIAPDFDVIATHEDGTIEAIIHQKLPMLGVQWHPEASPESPISDLVFDAFEHMIKS